MQISVDCVARQIELTLFMLSPLWQWNFANAALSYDHTYIQLKFDSAALTK